MQIGCGNKAVPHAPAMVRPGRRHAPRSRGRENEMCTANFRTENLKLWNLSQTNS